MQQSPLAPAVAQASQPATISVQAGPFTKGLRLNNDQLAGLGGFMLLMPLMIALAIRIVRRGTQRADALQPLIDADRFQRLEQAVDSIAVEVERIGESQRFQARLSAESPERMGIPK